MVKALMVKASMQVNVIAIVKVSLKQEFDISPLLQGLGATWRIPAIVARSQHAHENANAIILMSVKSTTELSGKPVIQFLYLLRNPQ